MASLTNPPDADDAIRDTPKYGKEMALYGATLAGAYVFGKLGVDYLGRPAVGTVKNGINAMTNAAEQADTGGDMGIEF